MRVSIDADVRVPLFEQIARAIQYEIAVGKLEDGALLPSVRQAAEEWGVHYLTVRRAYAALRDDGLVSSRPGVGTRVSAGRRRRSGAEEAAVPGGADGGANRGPPRPFGASVSVVECNAPQAADYAAQVSGALDAPVGTWILGDDGEPPPGRVIGTYFHFNEIRARWPHRGADLRFVSVVIDPDLTRRLSEVTETRDGPVRVRLLEVDVPRAHNAIPDLRTLLPPDRFVVESEIVTDLPVELATGLEAGPVLLPPRLWQGVDARTRDEAGVVLMRYLIAPPDLAALREEARASEPASGPTARRAS